SSPAFLSGIVAFAHVHVFTFVSISTTCPLSFYCNMVSPCPCNQWCFWYTKHHEHCILSSLWSAPLPRVRLPGGFAGVRRVLAGRGALAGGWGAGGGPPVRQPRAAYLRLVKRGNTMHLYHASPSWNRSSIEHNGLRKGMSKGRRKVVWLHARSH